MLSRKLSSICGSVVYEFIKYKYNSKNELRQRRLLRQTKKEEEGRVTHTLFPRNASQTFIHKHTHTEITKTHTNCTVQQSEMKGGEASTSCSYRGGDGNNPA